MKSAKTDPRGKILLILLPVLGLLSLSPIVGCTRESVRVALQTQRRADQVQQAVFDRQHETLRILLYRDLILALEADGVELTDSSRVVLNDAWNDRDLVEFWALQHERAAALRIIGVDAKLWSDQSIVDLLWKSLQARAKRAEQGLAAQVGERVTSSE